MTRRCNHTWSPLIRLPDAMTPDQRLSIGFAVALSRLDSYDRCQLCGRLSHITKSRWRRRKLLSCDTTTIEQRAAELQEWIGKQQTTEAVP